MLKTLYLKVLKPALGFKLSPSGQILYAVFLGVVFGVLFREKVAFVKVFGDIFIKMIKMTVVPLIFVSIVHVLCTMKDMLKMGQIAIKCLSIFIATTCVTVIMGILISVTFKPGINSGINPSDFIEQGKEPMQVEEFTFTKAIVNIFPDNPFTAFAKGDVLQILVFAVFFGLAINLVRTRAQGVVTLVDELSVVVYKLVSMVMKFTPIGVFGLVGYLAATQDTQALFSLLKLLVIFYSAGFVVVFVIYPIYIMMVGLKPMPFIKKMFEMQFFAFLTASSTATIPLTKFTAEKKLGATETTTSFGVPLGATVNMNGGALHFGIVAVFLAQIAGIDLSLLHYANIVFLALVLSIGTAGVPGGTLVMMPIILVSIGVPPDYIGIYIGIDRFLDMLRSAINVSGDAMTCIIVDKTSGNLDVEKYNSTSKEKFIGHK